MDIPYMTVQQAAVFLNRSDQTIRNWYSPKGQNQKFKNTHKNKIDGKYLSNQY